MSTEKNKRIEEILGSLDGVQRASAPDFFYTRLKARMEKGLEPRTIRKKVLYPAFALVAVILVVVLNAAILLNKESAKPSETASGNETEPLQYIAVEYNAGDVGSIFDINELK